VGLREGDRKGGDPPPLKWSDLRYVFDIKEDCNGKRTDPRNTVSTVSRVSDNDHEAALNHPRPGLEQAL
jgi:hypothetical protein